MDSQKCFICGEDCIHPASRNGLLYCYQCPICGCYSIPHKYTIREGLSKVFEENRSILIGFLFEYNIKNEADDVDSHWTDSYLPIDTNFISSLLDDSRIPRTPIQKTERLLTTMYRLSNDRIDVGFSITVQEKNDKSPFQIAQVEKGGENKYYYPISVSYADDQFEVSRMFQILVDLGNMTEDSGV